jgi:hypothetical protein
VPDPEAVARVVVRGRDRVHGIVEVQGDPRLVLGERGVGVAVELDVLDRGNAAIRALLVASLVEVMLPREIARRSRTPFEMPPELCITWRTQRGRRGVAAVAGPSDTSAITVARADRRRNDERRGRDMRTSWGRGSPIPAWAGGSCQTEEDPFFTERTL